MIGGGHERNNFAVADLFSVALCLVAWRWHISISRYMMHFTVCRRSEECSDIRQGDELKSTKQWTMIMRRFGPDAKPCIAAAPYLKLFGTMMRCVHLRAQASTRLDQRMRLSA